MVATVIVGMLCVHLLCFGGMFLLISTRLHDKKLGMDAFAVGNVLLGAAYILQLSGGAPDWNLMSVVNHTLTICVPAAYWVGGMRFFDRPAPLWRPLITLALAYTALQVLVQWTLGSVARYAMLSGFSALVFLVMTITVVYGVRTFAKDLRAEMVLFAVLIGGICILTAAKFVNILAGGLQALDMSSRFQMVFYIYMSFLATVLAPSIVWLVLRRLMDDLRAMAEHDPLTRLLNRRGLTKRLTAHFHLRTAQPAILFMLDIDHFKRTNDTYGHKVGDTVLSHVADVIRDTVRQSDLSCRVGGEEFITVCLDANGVSMMCLAERVRMAIENHVVPIDGGGETIQCTATLGVSNSFTSVHEFDRAMQQADAALYRGKAAERNQVVQSGDDNSTCVTANG
ncbi:MAG: GGDEF domain-containing protein [Herbaspirillum sp.]